MNVRTKGFERTLMALRSHQDAIWPSDAQAATNDRAFAVRLVRATLEWYGTRNNVSELAVKRSRRALAWIGPVLERRAAAAGIQHALRAAGEVESWIDPDASSQFRAAFALSPFLSGWPRHRSLVGDQRAWVERILGKLPVFASLRLEHGLSAVPWTSTIERATAYVMWLLAEDQYELGSSLKICPFTGRGVPYPHPFLDYRVDARGKFLRGQPQRFCNPEHANAYSQRELRARRSSRRHK